MVKIAFTHKMNPENLYSKRLNYEIKYDFLFPKCATISQVVRIWTKRILSGKQNKNYDWSEPSLPFYVRRFSQGTKSQISDGCRKYKIPNKKN